MENTNKLLEIIAKQNEVIIKQNMFISQISNRLNLFNSRSQNYCAIDHCYSNSEFNTLKKEAEEVLKLTKDL